MKEEAEIDSEKGRGLSKIKTTYYIESDDPEDRITNFINLIEKYCTVEITIIDTPEFERVVNIIK